MKFNLTLLSERSRKTQIFIAMLSGALFLSSCNDKDDIQPLPDRAAFSVINASPTRQSVDFYIENTRLPINGALLYGNTTRYWLARTGNRTGKVTVSGNTTSIGTSKFELENDRFHSIFITNSGDSVSLLRIRDNWMDNRQGNAQVRFVNLSPDAPNYSLEYVGDTTTFNNRAYKEFTPFKYVPAKTGITLNLKNTATNAVVATLPNIELRNGVIYTIWARGLVSLPTDTATRIKITRMDPNLN